MNIDRDKAERIAQAIGQATLPAVKRRQRLMEIYISDFETVSEQDALRATMKLVSDLKREDMAVHGAISEGIVKGLQNAGVDLDKILGEDSEIKGIGIDDEGEMMVMTEEGPISFEEAMERIGGVFDTPIDIEGIDLDAEAPEPEQEAPGICSGCGQEKTLVKDGECATCLTIREGVRQGKVDFDGKTD